jgi:hypothetical protein
MFVLQILRQQTTLLSQVLTPMTWRLRPLACSWPGNRVAFLAAVRLF